MYNPLLPYYQSNIYKSEPIGHVALWTLLSKIKQPKPQMGAILNDIRRADQEGNASLKAELKKHLVSFTPCVDCTRRKYDSIISFTGLVTTDNDKLKDEHEAAHLRDHIFNTHPEVIAAWRSTTRRGVRSLIRIPICNTVDEFKSYYNAIFRKFIAYKNTDKATQNPVLPMFYSDDPDIRIRTDFKTWNEQYYEPVTTSYNQLHVYQNDKDYSSSVYTLVKNKIDQINDNGHPQLRAICFALGGYVSSGYISESDAIYYVESLIRFNSYLGVKAKVNGYITTAKTMIRKGQNKPLKFEK